MSVHIESVLEGYVRRLRVQRGVIQLLLKRLTAHGCSFSACEICSSHGVPIGRGRE